MIGLATMDQISSRSCSAPTNYDYDYDYTQQEDVGFGKTNPHWTLTFNKNTGANLP